MMFTTSCLVCINQWLPISFVKNTMIFPSGPTNENVIHFHGKCEYKGISPLISDIMIKKEQYQKAWEKSLKHQMKVLPDFTIMFESVCTDLRELGIPE